MTDSLSMAVDAFTSHVLISFSGDETLLPKKVKLKYFKVKLKYINSALFLLIWKPMPTVTYP